MIDRPFSETGIIGRFSSQLSDTLRAHLLYRKTRSHYRYLGIGLIALVGLEIGPL
jgi:hypothetical protein